MDVEFKLQMQRFIGRGWSFFQFWKEQTTYQQTAFYSKDLAQIEWDTQAEILKSIKPRSKVRQFIVTDRAGWPPEKWEFILHQKEDEAALHGRCVLKKGNFLIVPFSKFKNTTQYRRMCNLIATRNRFKRYATKTST